MVSFLLNYSARAVRVHYKAVILFAVLQTLFLVLEIIPFVGFVGNLFSTVLTTSVSVYYGKRLLKEKENVIENLEDTSSNVLFDYFKEALGILTGSFVVFLPLIFFTGLTALAFGIIHPPTTDVETYTFIVRAFFFFLINLLLWGWFLYVLPYATGKGIKGEGFAETFVNFFKTFSSKEQFKTLNWEYFTLLFKASLLFLVFLFIFFLLLVTIVFIPLAFAFAYGFNVFYGGLCAYSCEILEEEPTTL